MEIKRLTPELVGDYLHFFDTTPHDDGIPEHRCYCVCWNSTNDENEDFSTAEARRVAAERFVRDGRIKGYLAYESGRVIGWCSANRKSECLKSRCGKSYLAPLSAEDDEMVKSIFCFAVAPEMRHNGVATALAETVCEDAWREGFRFVEAYPMKEFHSERYDYTGPAGLYEKLGFEVFRDLGDRLVVRKKLIYQTKG